MAEKTVTNSKIFVTLRKLYPQLHIAYFLASKQMKKKMTPNSDVKSNKRSIFASEI